MVLPLIFGIVLGAVTVIFALQNITVVTVTFYSLQFDGSLALILLLAVGTGILITLLMLLPESIRNYFRYRSLKKENASLEDELRRQKELTIFAKKDSYTPEVVAPTDAEPTL